MHLYQLSLQGFKNYREIKLNFPGQITSIVGDNGAGKTNILDAIHYLSFCKSYFNTVDLYSINHNSEICSVAGKLRNSPESSSIEVNCVLKRGHRKAFRVNGKEVDRLADHIGKIPAVMVSPYDSVIIEGGSEERRRYIDMVICQFDKGYLNDLVAYNRALIQRNALLKQMAFDIRFDASWLSVWNEQLAEYGSRIYQRRNLFISDFVPVFRDIYSYLSGDAESSGIEYISHLREMTDPLLLIASNTNNDRNARYTTTGIHKDDLKFMLSDVPVKRFGSQGQQKTFIVALKLAQFRFLADLLNMKPLLLLDDIFDKLDRSRIERLMGLVSNHHYGQIFITDTNSQRIDTIFDSIKSETDIIKIHNGELIH